MNISFMSYAGCGRAAALSCAYSNLSKILYIYNYNEKQHSKNS